jgi:DNA-binding SARP family transcriptional activator
MPIEAQLLGPPLLTRDGVVHAAARGKKVWGLLAYLALAEQPPTRQLLIDLLFPEAEDPANALRWNLSELRRLLGGPDTVGSGTTVGLRLPSGSVIDVHVLQAGTSAAAVELPGLGRALLEGVHIEATPGFDAWLLAERRRLASLSGAVLREGALRALALGNPAAAIALATRLVGADPLSADAHVLLVRSFAAAGDETAVQEQLTTSLELFRRELGLDLAGELYEAARMAPREPSSARAGPVTARALIESGEAAVSARGGRCRGRRAPRSCPRRRRRHVHRSAGVVRARHGARARDERPRRGRRGGAAPRHPGGGSGGRQPYDGSGAP